MMQNARISTPLPQVLMLLLLLTLVALLLLAVALLLLSMLLERGRGLSWENMVTITCMTKS
jgi:hypothetical protein